MAEAETYDDNNIPRWIDKSFIQSAILSYEKTESVEILNFSIEPKDAPANSYDSTVYHASISYKLLDISKVIKVVIKTHPIIENSHQFDDEKTLNVEANVYNILSEIQSLMQSIGDNDVLCPKFIYQTMKPQPVIILEDVNAIAYDQMIEANAPMDFEFSKMIARRLGKFHAGSFYMQKNKKLKPSAFTFSIYDDFQCINMLFDKPLRIFIDVISTWKGFEKFIEPLKEFRKNFATKGIKSYQRNRGSFAYNVLNHGDFNTRNVLFKKNEKSGEICDMMLLDFQACVYASPAIDLTYAIYSFLSDENRQKHRDEFIAVYHQQFVESLKSFGYIKPPPSLMDLQIEMLRNGNLQVITAICLRYMNYFDYKSLEPGDFMNGMRELKVKAFNSCEFKKMIAEELPRFLYSGIL